ncbi:hypothetical protein BP5796_06808 [Coleophoma crateriformis]|uniref:DUF1776-domain-containing protein n=1 Tax=Coleophoma crateriformis TaxID=565419 RepID=A0A3D8RPI1_9HELO|nr:hypothetical protein BP5796_06808 [Coleophoma crateriformis]
MSADDQAFLDVLSSVPNDIRRYSNDVADYVDKHIEKAAGVLREALSSAQWIPESARPSPPPAPKPLLNATMMPGQSMYMQVHSWVMRHKIWTTVIVFAVGGVTYHIIKRNRKHKKRRARRAGNGARLEVVVVAGSPSEPLTRSISLDLERRGFIVYVVCNTIEEEMQVQNESRSDIKPLMINIVNPSSAHASIDRFLIHLQTPHAAFQGARPHHLALRSLIIIPSLTYPTSPIATLSPSTLSDLLNTRLLNPILTIQTFLPLLTTPPASHSNSTPAKPSVLLLTPSIIPSLSPAFHATESTIISGLTSFARVLSAELSPLDIPVTHLQLGNFDLSSFTPKNQLQTLHAQRPETQWPEGARQAYGRNFTTLTSGRGVGSTFGKGSGLRELNDAVFDSMTSNKSGIVRVGQGARVYGFVGSWVPRGLVGWMMGVRSAGPMRTSGAGIVRSEESSSRSISPGSSGLSDSEYIDLHGYSKSEDDS